MSKKYALLTGTIDSSVYNNVGNTLTDISERLSQYEDSIKKYIIHSAFTDIVFAENSGYPFETEKYISLAESVGKRFEFVPCTHDVQGGIEYGKSYGEALILREALNKSLILPQEGPIYKLTGRVFLLNSRAIVSSANVHRNEFLIVDSQQWCYTHIFKFDRQDFQKYLIKSDQAIMEHRVNLEHTYYRLLGPAIKKQEIDISCFRVWPYIEGIHGTTGCTYKSTWKGRIYHDLLCISKAYTMNSPLQRFVRF